MTINAFFSHPATVAVIAGIVVVALTALGRLLLWMGSAKADHTNFNAAVDEIRKDIKDIRANIVKLFERLPPRVIRDQSPVTLSDYGETVSAAVDAPSWAERHAEALYDEAEGEAPYRVEEISFAYAQEWDLDSTIRQAIFEHGFERSGVRMVLGVVLRDELLRKLG